MKEQVVRTQLSTTNTTEIFYLLTLVSQQGYYDLATPPDWEPWIFLLFIMAAFIPKVEAAYRPGRPVGGIL